MKSARQQKSKTNLRLGDVRAPSETHGSFSVIAKGTKLQNVKMKNTFELIIINSSFWLKAETVPFTERLPLQRCTRRTSAETSNAPDQKYENTGNECRWLLLAASICRCDVINIIMCLLCARCSYTTLAACASVLFEFTRWNGIKIYISFRKNEIRYSKTNYAAE